MYKISHQLRSSLSARAVFKAHAPRYPYLRQMTHRADKRLAAMTQRRGWREYTQPRPRRWHLPGTSGPLKSERSQPGEDVCLLLGLQQGREPGHAPASGTEDSGVLGRTEENVLLDQTCPQVATARRGA